MRAAPDDVNVTTFKGYDGEQHVHKQYIFGDTYVHTEDGVITARQAPHPGLTIAASSSKGVMNSSSNSRPSGS